jgi:EAL domain-containing protein (putative c-di-GMP-specific phosphodiesterase class I)
MLRILVLLHPRILAHKIQASNPLILNTLITNILVAANFHMLRQAIQATPTHPQVFHHQVVRLHRITHLSLVDSRTIVRTVNRTRRMRPLSTWLIISTTRKLRSICSHLMRRMRLKEIHPCRMEWIMWI